MSSVIADFSLANMAWLKAPVGAAAIPTTQLLAFSYAALEPSKELLGKYMKEIDRLESQGTITERDHQLLRSSPRAYEELMHLTLGEDAALTTETVTQMLKRVTNEIKKEVSERLTEEQAAHQETRTTLSSQKDRHQRIISDLYWRCRREAGVVAWILSAVIVVAPIGSLAVAGLGLSSANPILAWVLKISAIVLALLTLVNFVVGFTVRRLHQWVQNRCLTWFLKRQAKAIAIDLDEFLDME